MPRNTLGNLHRNAKQPHFIREWRRYRKLNQEKFADAIGTTKASISRIENGLQGYSQGMLEAAAATLDCQVADLLARHPVSSAMPWSLWNAADDEDKSKIVTMMNLIVKNKEMKG